MSGRIAVFASGGGTNLQALLDHFSDSGAGEIALVVADRMGTGAVERAARAGIQAQVIEVEGRPEAAVAADTLDALRAARVDVVALAGYLKLLPVDLVRRFAYRILNIHPALLPAFGGRGMYGQRVHRAVLQSGCRVTGATVHFVNEQYDEGRVVAQWPVPVLPGDTPEALAARVLEVEHVLYPAAVEWLVTTLAAASGGADEAAPAPSAPDGPSEMGGFRLAAAGPPDASHIRHLLGLN